MLNKSFEGGSEALPEHGNIYEPDHWEISWRDGGYAPHDLNHDHPYTQPECFVIKAEPPHLDPLRITHGTQAVHIFTFYSIHDVVLSQRIPVPKGSKVMFSCKAHAWSSTDDNPHTSDQDGDAYENFTFRVGIDPYGDIDPWDQSVVWQLGKHIYDIYSQVPSLSVTAQADYVTLFIRSTVKYPFKHCDAYIDDCELVIELPEPTPPTNTIPDGGYDKEYWVVPSDIVPERRIDIYKLAGAEQKTCGPSADDSRSWATELIDAGKQVKAVVWDRKQEDIPNWDNYFKVREPRIVVEFRGNTPEPPPPPPPVGPEPIVHYSGNFVGLHSATLKQGWDTYAIEAKPTVMKLFSCGDAMEAKARNPNMLVVWRKHIGNDGSYLEGDIKANMQKVVNWYAEEVDTHSKNTGIPVATIIKQIDVMEGLNETYPTFNVDHLLRAVDADLWFSQLLNAEFGAEIKAGIFTAAVGNPYDGSIPNDPRPSEFPLLLSLAKESHEGRAHLGYHGYWAADENQSYLVEHFPVHSGRWQEMDKVFNAAGYYPTWYLGECGICYTYPQSNGWSFVPTRGWKSCGPFSDYIQDLVAFNDNIILWNAENQGRCFGGTIFAFGGWGWGDFNFEPGDLAELANAMSVYA